MDDRKSSLKLKVLVLLGLCVQLMFICSCGKLKQFLGLSPSYLNFIDRDQKYYAELAGACDYLLSQSKQVPTGWVHKDGTSNNEWLIPTDEKLLPAVIQNLHATTIKVTSGVKDQGGSVRIMIGSPRPDYGIVWKQNEYGKVDRVWELTTAADGLVRIHYSTRNH